MENAHSISPFGFEIVMKLTDRAALILEPAHAAGGVIRKPVLTHANLIQHTWLNSSANHHVFYVLGGGVLVLDTYIKTRW